MKRIHVHIFLKLTFCGNTVFSTTGVYEDGAESDPNLIWVTISQVKLAVVECVSADGNGTFYDFPVLALSRLHLHLALQHEFCRAHLEAEHVVGTLPEYLLRFRDGLGVHQCHAF